MKISAPVLATLVHSLLPAFIVPLFALRVLVEQHTCSAVELSVTEIFDVTLVARSSVSPGQITVWNDVPGLAIWPLASYAAAGPLRTTHLAPGTKWSAAFAMGEPPWPDTGTARHMCPPIWLLSRAVVAVDVGELDGDAVAANEPAQLRAMQPQRAGGGRDVAVAGAQRILDPLVPRRIHPRRALARFAR